MVFDKITLDKITELATSKVLTISTMVDRAKINGSLARKALRDLESRGLIRKVLASSTIPIYTRATPAVEAVKA